MQSEKVNNNVGLTIKRRTFYKLWIFVVIYSPAANVLVHFHCCQDKVLVYVEVDSLFSVEIEIIVNDVAPGFYVS